MLGVDDASDGGQPVWDDEQLDVADDTAWAWGGGVDDAQEQVVPWGMRERDTPGNQEFPERVGILDHDDTEPVQDYRNMVAAEVVGSQDLVVVKDHNMAPEGADNLDHNQPEVVQHRTWVEGQNVPSSLRT